MIILWRYLLTNYLKVLGLSVLAFIALLIISRLHETANFASLGAPLSALFFFVLYQFPYILPIAIPVSCLISSLLLMQRMSTSNELTAFRASGIGIGKIIAPVLIAGAFLSILNFYMVSEVATNSHLSSKQMVQELASLNPLALLKNKQFLHRKDAFISASKSSSGTFAKDVLVVVHQKSHERLGLFFAKELSIDGRHLYGKNVSLVSSMDSTEENNFDHLVIENQKETSTPASEFTRLLHKTSWHLCPDHLHMRLLLARLQLEKQTLKKAQEQKLILKEPKKRINQCLTEVVRRFSLGFAPFSFTLMGTAFGMEVSRHRGKKAVLSVLGLAALTFAAFFLAKSSDANLFLSSSLYIIPQVIVVALSIWTITRVSRGIE